MMTEKSTINSARPSTIQTTVLVVIAVLWFVLAWAAFSRAHIREPLLKGPGVTGARMLSEWHTGIEETPVDTEVFEFDSGVEGARVLILFGTHPNEPASVVAGAVMAENAICESGKLYIIPRTNASGFTHGDPQEGYLQRFEIPLPDGGTRWFRFGSRYTNPVHQWPDPTLHINPAGQTLAGVDSRNLNRCYPGRPEGMLTEQLAYAITQLVRLEDIDLVIDIHEAAPEYPAVNVMVAHERAAELAAMARLMLEDTIPGFAITDERSPVNLRGLVHREMGDHTDAFAVLMETANPAQGRLKGRSSATQIVEGIDAAYAAAYETQLRLAETSDGRPSRTLLYATPYDDEDIGYPMAWRVARHLSASVELMNWLESDRGPIMVTGVPTHQELVENGVGHHLMPAPEED